MYLCHIDGQTLFSHIESSDVGRADRTAHNQYVNHACHDAVQIYCNNSCRINTTTLCLRQIHYTAALAALPRSGAHQLVVFDDVPTAILLRDTVDFGSPATPCKRFHCSLNTLRADVHVIVDVVLRAHRGKLQCAS